MLIKNEELIHEWRKATGWSAEKVKEELPKLMCNYWDALKVYLCAGRMPTSKEQDILNQYSFHACKALWERRLL